jgi:hypothetical protein
VTQAIALLSFVSLAYNHSRTLLLKGENMAQSSLIKKLLLKSGQRIAILNAPPGYLDSLGALPEVFPFLKDDGIFWVSYPKGSSKVKTDLNRDILWTVMEKYALAGVAMISINEVWSAMRFRPADKVGKSKK